ncbi:MAG: LysO family transporter [Thermoanaerobacteraceae bacterium]|nr:LysO family transporter [Thermoanaerobacteraceae bacterium]
MIILDFMSKYSMYFYIVFILLGTLLGYYGKVPGMFKSHNGKIQTWCLGILLFAIGLEIGSNRDVLMVLGTIGLKAAVISIMSVVGTICCINIAARMFSRERMRSS